MLWIKRWSNITIYVKYADCFETMINLIFDEEIFLKNIDYMQHVGNGEVSEKPCDSQEIKASKCNS